LIFLGDRSGRKDRVYREGIWTPLDHSRRRFPVFGNALVGRKPAYWSSGATLAIIGQKKKKTDGFCGGCFGLQTDFPHPREPSFCFAPGSKLQFHLMATDDATSNALGQQQAALCSWSCAGSFLNALTVRYHGATKRICIGRSIANAAQVWERRTVQAYRMFVNTLWPYAPRGGRRDD